MIIKLYYQIVFGRSLKDSWELKNTKLTVPLVVESEQSLLSCKGVKEQIFQNSIEIMLHFNQSLNLQVIGHPQKLFTILIKENYIRLKNVAYRVEGVAKYWHEFTDCTYQFNVLVCHDSL